MCSISSPTTPVKFETEVIIIACMVRIFWPSYRIRDKFAEVLNIAIFHGLQIKVGDVYKLLKWLSENVTL